MKFSILMAIFRKELLDTIRDKRTIVMMIAIPMVLYPMLMIIGAQFAMHQQNQLESNVSKIALTGDCAALLQPRLDNVEKIKVVNTLIPWKALARGAVDAVAVVNGDVEQLLEAGECAPLEVHYDGTRFSSMQASNRLVDALSIWNEEIRSERLALIEVSEDYINPFQIKELDAAPPNKTTGNLLGMALPGIMVISIVLGAFYPAIDVTAGEKERGTFETLLSTPTTKRAIVTGKFFAVFLLAVITGLLNLLSMGMAMLFVLSQVKNAATPDMSFNIHLPPQAYGIMLLTIIPLAFFISAAMMAVAVLARSFKEAQNYLTPLLLFMIIPAMASAVPDLTLGPLTIFMPIANVTLLFKELMVGTASGQEIFSVLLANVLIAVIALVIAERLFQREEVVLSGDKGLTLSFARKTFPESNALSSGAALALYAFLLMALVYIGGWVQSKDIIIGLLITEWVILLLPTLGLLWLFRVRWRPALHWNMPHPLIWPGTLLTAFSAIILMFQLGLWSNKVLPVPEELESAMEAMFISGDTFSGVLVLFLAIAVSPAICEELFFRGVLLSALHKRIGTVLSVLLVGFLFGLFHISIYRIFPTAMLGMLLTWIAIRGNSIFPAILAHLCINGSIVIFTTGGRGERLLAWMGLDTPGTEKLPVGLLAVSVILFIFGLAWIEGGHYLKNLKKSGT